MANTFLKGTIKIGEKEYEVKCYKKGSEFRATFDDRKHHDVKLHANSIGAYIIQNNVKYFIKPR